MTPPETEVRNPLATHNGLFTVRSTRTGEHRTFRVRTQPADARFAPGRRVLALLSGPENETSYTGFAFLETYGDPLQPEVRVHVWGKRRGPPGAPSAYETLARFLERLPGFIAQGKAALNYAGACRVCNRTLTTPESVRDGIGPVCAGR